VNPATLLITDSSALLPGDFWALSARGLPSPNPDFSLSFWMQFYDEAGVREPGPGALVLLGLAALTRLAGECPSTPKPQGCWLLTEITSPVRYEA
jgi:hypothetical protein